MDKPLFTIITATFNSASTLRRTLESVQSQSFKDWEHVIIDGLSRDATLAIAAEFSDSRRKVQSEADRGIYDAMNKGIRMAQGRYLCFLNSDDYFCDSDVLFDMASTLQKSTSLPWLLYGTGLRHEEGKLPVVLGRRVTVKDYYYEAPLIHQAMFFSLESFAVLGLYDLTVKGGAADWHWLTRLFYEYPNKTQFVNRSIVDFYMGGATSRYLWQNFVAQFELAMELFPWKVKAKYFLLLPITFMKVKVLRTHEDSALRRVYRNTLRALGAKRFSEN